MVRRIASQVHKQASRLTRSGFIKTLPAWYQAVLDHPPLPLPPREPPSRTSYDTKPPKQSLRASPKEKTQGPHRPLPISYIEDEVRRQFFRDHPFESFRPRTITEAGIIEDEHPVRGLQWTRLFQRSRNPSSEDAVQFTLNLHEAHGLPLSDAYATSIAQFRTLRAVQQVSTRFAALGATAYGARFGPSATTSGHEAENRILEANELRTERLDDSARLARRRWRMVPLGSPVVGDDVADSGAGEGDAADRNAWSRGEEYVRLWKEGVRPDYSPALTEPISPTLSKFDLAASADFMGTRNRGPRVRP